MWIYATGSSRAHPIGAPRVPVRHIGGRLHRRCGVEQRHRALRGRRLHERIAEMKRLMHLSDHLTRIPAGVLTCRDPAPTAWPLFIISERVWRPAPPCDRMHVRELNSASELVSSIAHRKQQAYYVQMACKCEGCGVAECAALMEHEAGRPSQAALISAQPDSNATSRFAEAHRVQAVTQLSQVTL